MCILFMNAFCGNAQREVEDFYFKYVWRVLRLKFSNCIGLFSKV